MKLKPISRSDELTITLIAEVEKKNETAIYADNQEYYVEQVQNAKSYILVEQKERVYGKYYSYKFDNNLKGIIKFIMFMLNWLRPKIKEEG